MTNLKIAFIAVLVLAAALVCPAQSKSGKSSLVVVYKDGHQKTFSTADVSRIDFKGGTIVVSHGGGQESIPVSDIVRFDFKSADASKSRPYGRNHFVGKWEFGQGQGLANFFVTLNADGEASKTIGASHGTWTVVDGEARISWDDGWRDVIRVVGGKHEKFAYEPGKSLNDEPSNVTNAKSLNSEPI